MTHKREPNRLQLWGQRRAQSNGNEGTTPHSLKFLETRSLPPGTIV